MPSVLVISIKKTLTQILFKNIETICKAKIMTMKTFTILSLLFVTNLLIAQHWAFFPVNQNTYYSTNNEQFPSDSDFIDIQYIAADSFRTTLTNEIWYLNSKYLPDSILNCIKPKPMDSLLFKNDTLFYHNFYFLPNAKLGDSWYLPYSYKTWFDSIKITYSKVEQTAFLGITDSVKTYNFKAIGNEADETNLNERVMRLSKHFGLIEYVPLQSLTRRESYSPYFESATIYGIKNDTLQVGYQQKRWEDFLPQYNKGDILFWRKDFSPIRIPTICFNRDSITEIIENGDSLYYVYNRTTINGENEVTEKLDGLTEGFGQKSYLNIINAKPGLAGFGSAYNSAILDSSYFVSNEGLSISTNERTQYVWHHILHRYNLKDNYTLIEANIYFNKDDIVYMDSCSSRQTRYLHYFKLKTGKGKIAYGITGHQYSNVESLIGTKINGVEEGILSVSAYNEVYPPYVGTNVAENLLPQPLIKLYPNPANNSLFVNYNKTKLANINYQILDINARSVMENQLQEERINISTLMPGIYFFKFQVNNKYHIIKFIKL